MGCSGSGPVIPHAAPEMVPLRAVAAELHIEPAKLRRMARQGAFPPLLRVTQKHYLVARAQVDEWKAGRWTTSEATRAAIIVDAVRGPVVNRRRKVAR